MASLNQLTLMGNLTKDVELRTLQGGATVADLSLAVNEIWKDRNGDKKEEVMFIECVCWNKTAEIAAQYLKKGNSVLLTGKLKQDRWEKDGVKHNRHKMSVDKLVMLTQRVKDDSSEAPHETPRSEPPRREPEAPSQEVSKQAKQYQDSDEFLPF